MSRSISSKSGTASGSNAWVTGLTSNYGDLTEVRLYSPSFNCTAAGTYTLKFKTKNRFEIGYDGYIVEYSLNSGGTWSQLGTSVLSGWNDFANTSGTTAFPVNQPFFNATRTSFTQMSYVFSSLAGNNKVCFRIVFKSDVGTNYEGMAVDDFEILGPINSAMPVALTHFNAQRMSPEEVTLNWRTSSEQNNKGFEVQKSTDGIQFNDLFFVPGKNNSNTIQKYVYADTDAKQDHLYYRLKQVDFNGKFQYSQVVAVGLNKFDEQLATVAQVPNAKSLFIETQSNNLNARILNLGGQELKSFALTPGNQKYLFDELPSGIYLLELSDNKGTKQVEKILLMQ